MSTLKEVPDILLRVHQDMRAAGRQRAALSGAVEARSSDLEVLESHARTAARELYRENYSPALLEHDRLREAEFERLQAERSEAELGLKNAQADVAEQGRAVALAPRNLKRPEASPALVAAAVVVLAASTAPTFHDAVFVTLADDATNWVLSMLLSAALGVFVALGILSNLEAGERRTPVNWAALGGGSVIVVGLALFRLKDAIGTGEIIFCLALVMIEVGTVVFLEGYAASLRGAHRRFAEARAAADGAAALLQAAEDHQDRCEERLAKITGSVASHIHFVEERYTRRYHIEEVEAAAVEAVRDGYTEGVAANKGRLVGVKGGRQ